MIEFSFLKIIIDSWFIGFYFPDNDRHTLVSFKTPYCMPSRNYYYNTEHHPSKIVRGYRKTRNWLTEHFVFSDRRISNMYSAYIMLIFFSAFFWVLWYFDLSGGPNAGLDVDRTQKKKE